MKLKGTSIVAFAAIVFLAAFVSFGCGAGDTGNSGGNVMVVEQAPQAAEGLNLEAIGNLAKQAKSAEDFERLLNQPDGINNLDLDQDGNVDYIQVAETNNPRGFSLYVDLGDGQKQDIAKIEFSASGNQGSMNVYGSPSVYGADAGYRSSFTTSDFFLFVWLTRPHPLYYSPYRYGYYPSWHHAYVVVPPSSYRTRTIVTTRTTTVTKVAPSASNAQSKSWSNAEKVRAPLRNPTQAQSSFQVRNPSKPVGRWNAPSNGGASRPSPVSRPSKTSTPSRTPSRSTSGGRRH